MKPGRKLITSGLLKKCKLDKNIFTRDTEDASLFLFNDALVVTSKILNSYAFKAIIDFNTSGSVRIKDIPDMELVQNVFYLISPLKTFTFMASNNEEKIRWINLINGCLSESIERTRSFESMGVRIENVCSSFFKVFFFDYHFLL